MGYTVGDAAWQSAPLTYGGVLNDVEAEIQYMIYNRKLLICYITTVLI